MQAIKAIPDKGSILCPVSCLLLSVFLVFVFIARPSYGQWAATYGGSSVDGGTCIQQTSDGGYIVAGSTASFGAGNGDLWLLKLNTVGSIAWQKLYGGTNGDGAESIQQTNDGGYIVAGSTLSFGAGGMDCWILKLDSGGDIEWEKTYGGSNDDYATSICQTKDGYYIVAGHTLSFGGGNSNIWILKLHSNGDIQWQKTYGGVQWQLDLPHSVKQTIEGGYIVAGVTHSFGAGFPGEVWLLKLNSGGAVEWEKAYGGVGVDSATSVQQTSDGGYIAAGGTSSFGAGGTDCWILKLDSGGNIEWEKTYGESNDDGANSIYQCKDGGYIVAGDTTSFGTGDYDAWVLKLRVNGTVEWQKTYGGVGVDSAACVQQTSDGGYIIAGQTGSFGTGDDVWVLKLRPDGFIDSSCNFNRDTSVSGMDSSSTVTISNAIISDTNITPQTSSAMIQDTNVLSNYICQTTEEDDCNNGFDDDLDGLVDCDDPDCDGQCPEVGRCDDGRDNDGDGDIDCADSDCNGQACNDGNPCTENDVCVSGVCRGTFKNCDDNNECTFDVCISGDCRHFGKNCLLTPCAIGCDPAIGCIFDTECEHTIQGGCSDGEDNDRDGLVDCRDPDCAGDPACPIPALTPLGTIVMALLITFYGIRELRNGL